MFKSNIKVRQIWHVFKGSEEQKLENTLSPFLREKESFMITALTSGPREREIFTPNESVIEKDYETPNIKF